MKNEKKYNNKEDSIFVARVRIKKKQLEWLKKNKDTKTIAGFLDKIINEWKNLKSISKNIKRRNPNINTSGKRWQKK